MITTTIVPTRTMTEVKPQESVNNLSIVCFPSMNDDGTSEPEIYSSKILNEELNVDNVRGIEGELLISSDYPNSASLQNGDLIVTPSNDEADRYSLDTSNGDLNYEK